MGKGSVYVYRTFVESLKETNYLVDQSVDVKVNVKILSERDCESVIWIKMAQVAHTDGFLWALQ
jgi:hypothetical protein